MQAAGLAKESYQYGFSDPEKPVFKSRRGLDREIVAEISALKGEPDWMRDFRLRALDIFLSMPTPAWGADLAELDFGAFRYFVRSSDKSEKSWDDVPEDIKKTFDRLGLPEAEKKFLSGVGAQYESEAVYHSLREDLEAQGVIFLDMDSALRQRPDLVRQYLSRLVPANDNKFAALNSAVWSGGSFVFVPRGVKVEVPVEAYFRINSSQMGQFERTLIIAEEDSQVNYVEGCTAPIYSADSLHAAVVEIFAKPGARVRYTTIQNWSNNVLNLVTKRARAERGALMEWIDGNLGSRITMKYPSVVLAGEGARADILSIAFAGKGQHLDAGGKVIHVAPNTSSHVLSKSISRDGGRSSYRGLVKMAKGATNARSSVRCDALILDPKSRSDTYPYMDINESTAQVSHEATVSRIDEEQLYYLRSRGIPEQEAALMVVNGFIEPLVRELPMQFAVELNRLIRLQMEGAVG